MTQQANPPGVVVEAAERQLRAHAVGNELRDLVLANVDRIRAAVEDEQLRR